MQNRPIGLVINTPEHRVLRSSGVGRELEVTMDLKRGCGFPILRLVAIFSLASGALLEAAIGSFRTAEVMLFHSLTVVLKAKDILPADWGFCSYFDIAWLGGQKVNAVVRLHARRSVTT